MRPKEVRARAGLSLIQAAVLAGKAEGTVRVYEADPEAVSKKSRADLDAVYARLAAASEASSLP